MAPPLTAVRLPTFRLGDREPEPPKSSIGRAECVRDPAGPAKWPAHVRLALGQYPNLILLLAVFALLAFEHGRERCRKATNQGSRRGRSPIRGYAENVILTNGRLTAG